MLKVDLTTIIRSLSKNGFYVFANVVSLAVGLAICVIGYFNYHFNHNFNDFFSQADTIYKISLSDKKSGRILSQTPLALQEQLAKHPSMKAFRFTYGSGTSKVNQRLYPERIGFCDEEFLRSLQYPDSGDDPVFFRGQEDLILSEATARRLFPDGSALGRQVQLAFEGKERTYEVAAVIAEWPNNTSFHFSMLLPMSTYRDAMNIDRNDWKHWVDATFVHTLVSRSSIQLELAQHLTIINQRNPGREVDAFRLDNLHEWPGKAQNLSGNVFRNSLHPASVLGTISSAVFVLLLASFNFINTNLTLVGKRLKEMAVKKMLGATRWHLTRALFLENLLLLVAALVLSVVVSYYLFPRYNAMFAFNIVQFQFLDWMPFLVVATTLMGLVIFINAGYPALYINRISALEVFRHTWKVGRAGLIFVVLLVFQFSICIYNLFSLFVFTENALYQQNLDRGYKYEQVLNIPIEDPADLASLRDALKAKSQVTVVTNAGDLIGFSHGEAITEIDGEEHFVANLQVGSTYLQALRVQLLDGRFFFEGEAPGKSVLVNEEFQRQLGKPLAGTRISINGQAHKVIGLVKDFNLKTILLDNKIRPTVITLNPEEAARYLVIAYEGKDEALRQLATDTWYKLFPNKLFNGFFQEKVIEPLDETNNIILNINGFVAIAALLICIVGLYSMVSLTIQARIREFGIRKVLGASVLTVAYLINRPVIMVLAVASAVGLVGGFLFINNLLDIIYAYHLAISLRHFLIPLIVILFAVLFSILARVYAAAKENPVAQLRSE